MKTGHSAFWRVKKEQMGIDMVMSLEAQRARIAGSNECKPNWPPKEEAAGHYSKF